MAVLDAIFCQNWLYRYYSYNSEWSDDEEFFEMRNGEGDQLLILFKNEGTVINGFSADADPGNRDVLKTQLPDIFHEFMFGEPVYSTGTTFCIWQEAGEDWKSATLSDQKNRSEEMLSPLDGIPATYIRWATDYFKGSYKEPGISIDVVTRIFNQEPLTTDIILSLINELEDREQLLEDLSEISYPHHISD